MASSQIAAPPRHAAGALRSAPEGIVVSEHYAGTGSSAAALMATCGSAPLVAALATLAAYASPLQTLHLYAVVTGLLAGLGAWPLLACLYRFLGFTSAAHANGRNYAQRATARRRAGFPDRWPDRMGAGYAWRW